MIHHSPSRASAALFKDQVKAATPKLHTKSANALAPCRAMRVVGTLHLPVLGRSR